MIPFLHLGPLGIPTFGLMVALGMPTAAYFFYRPISIAAVRNSKAFPLETKKTKDF